MLTPARLHAVLPLAGPALLLAGAALAHPAQEAPPVEPGSREGERIVVDTRVADVRVNEDLTLAVLDTTSRSPCPSNDYVYLRQRPKWLFQTGRLLQAMRERAEIRVSFSCIAGFQHINAIRFLTPLVRPAAQDSPPRRAGVAAPRPFARPVPSPSAVPEPLPLPSGAPAASGATPSGRGVRPVPLP